MYVAFQSQIHVEKSLFRCKILFLKIVKNDGSSNYFLLYYFDLEISPPSWLQSATAYCTIAVAKQNIIFCMSIYVFVLRIEMENDLNDFDQATTFVQKWLSRVRRPVKNLTSKKTSCSEFSIRVATTWIVKKALVCN